MSDSLKHKILSGVFWQGLCNIGSKGLNFVFSIILARLLAPEDFGSVAILMIFITIAEVFVDSGFSTALIQKKDTDDIDCSSVFYINIVVAVALYCVFFVAAPWIAEFYRNPKLTVYFRCLALGTLFRSFSLVQGALLTKRMLFHLNFRIAFCALLISGIQGITMAYCGFGVWALIAQQLTNALITAILLWLLVKWRPQLSFVWDRIRMLFQFGSKLLATSLLNALFNNLFGMIVGRLFDLSTLAYYDRGRHIPAVGMGIINSTIGSVIFPAFAKMQDDRAQMRLMAQKCLKITMFFVVPAMGLLAIMARPLVIVLLTDKWLPSVIFLQLSCLVFLVWPLHTLNLQVIMACGRSDTMLVLEIIKKVQTIAVLLLTWPYGVVAMVWGLAVNGVLCAVENAWPNRKLIAYSFVPQFKDILPYLFSAGAASLLTMLLIIWLPVSLWLQLITGSFLYAVVYLGGLMMIRGIPPEIFSLGRKVMKLNHAE